MRASLARPSTGGVVREIFRAESWSAGDCVFAGSGVDADLEGAAVGGVVSEGRGHGRRWGIAFAEDGGADADAGAALFDGDGEVVGHADGELGEGGVEALLFVAEAAEFAEVGAGGFGVFGAGPGGTVIRPVGMRFSRGAMALRRVGRSSGARPCLVSSWESLTSMRMGSFLLRAAAAELRRWAILRESTVSMAWKSSAARVVLLDWRGPMRWNFGGGEGGDGGGFFCEFLDAVFAEEALAGGVGFQDGFGGVHLADGHEGDFAGGRLARGRRRRSDRGCWRDFRRWTSDFILRRGTGWSFYRGWAEFSVGRVVNGEYIGNHFPGPRQF